MSIPPIEGCPPSTLQYTLEVQTRKTKQTFPINVNEVEKIRNFVRTINLCQYGTGIKLNVQSTMEKSTNHHTNKSPTTDEIKKTWNKYWCCYL